MDFPFLNMSLLLPLVVGLSVAALFLMVLRSRPPGDVSEDIVKNPIDGIQIGEAKEHRHGRRRGGNTVEIDWRFPSDQQTVGTATVIDRSLGGLRLFSLTEFAPDTIICVLPQGASKMVPWVEIEIRSCSEVRDGFELGCQFVKTPPYSILLLFG